MRTRSFWLIVSVLLVAPASRASASHTPLDTAFVLTSMSFPVLALDPVTGDRHLAYLSNSVLQHSWETSGAWQTEAIEDSASFTTYTGFDLREAPDGHPVAAYVRNGVLVCARRVAGVWNKDTLATALPGPWYPIALALHPSSGEPAVAWARKGTPSTIWYARRSAGAWTAQVVDTVSSWWLTVALGLDGAGRPHLAWGRPRADAAYATVLTYAGGVGPDGPFTAAPVDSQLSTFLQLEVDRSNGEPRLAYDANDGPGATPTRVRYAFRGPGDVWQWMNAFNTNNDTPYSIPSLALDPAGNPFIGYTDVINVEPNGEPPTTISSTEACTFVNTGIVTIHSRAGGAGTGTFAVEDVSRPGQSDAKAGPRSLASRQLGQATIAWRSPRLNCQPYALSTSQVSGPSVVGVGPGVPGAVGLPSVWPNPARSGDDLRVEFTLAREAAIALELHDLAGRRVAVRSLAAVAPGPHAISWSVPDLAPGHYWLTMRSNGERMGTRSVVILR